MDDAERKEQQRQRFLKGFAKHHVGHEEEKRRKSASARRRAERTDGPARRRDWDDEDDGFESFEKIRKTRHTRAAGPRADVSGLPRAYVAAVHHGQVELDHGATARIAGQLLIDPEFRLAVGDEVAYSETEGQARIEARLERRTCLSRPDPGQPNRSLVLAANVDIAVIVVSAKNPPLRPGLIDRLLLAVEHGGAAPAICVNKVDLLDATERATLNETLVPYADLGCAVFCCSAEQSTGIDALAAHLVGSTCVFVGHSGVGKSSILNRLDPAGARRTGETREFDGRGRHTTTWSTLRELEGGTRVIDTPGVRSFGLDRVDASQVRAGFADFAPFVSACRYGDCTHQSEPDCGVRAAAETGSLSADRYASYLRILADL